ncbi:hypothetical protein AAIA72_01490 [Hahella sp. SMD15-11]|uniref:DUF2550 family protein n=1 Tax=Thermohahella caldifontis TaxID=3142973 RepID=A0AB39UWG3_9GAMM
MAWLWIIVGVVFIVGTLTWLLPSPWERKVQKVRSRAMKQGVHVRRMFSRDLPETLPEAEGPWYLYWVTSGNADTQDTEYIPPPPDLSAALGEPSRLLGVRGPGYVGVIWNEEPPEEAALESVVNWIRSLRQTPETPASR